MRKNVYEIRIVSTHIISHTGFVAINFVPDNSSLQKPRRSLPSPTAFCTKIKILLTLISAYRKPKMRRATKGVMRYTATEIRQNKNKIIIIIIIIINAGRCVYLCTQLWLAIVQPQMASVLTS